MTEIMRSELLDVRKMIDCIKSRADLSAPGPDGLTFPILKIGKERTVLVPVSLIKMMLNWKKCPDCGKVRRHFTLQGWEQR
jgi:hypothetical protein